ncbi:recombinase zinc beta ribbon domain-containing protein [Candidatus Nomurabacteria bacterium]|nr:recombinase zinc beta ribbon domain-containing protein [Candidatus Nomurabacteria bacterium]
MLKEPFYYGAMRWNDQVYSGRHEPLITKELFDKVQNLLTRKKVPHYKSHSFMFRKLLTCGECEGTITGEIQKGIIYYHCNHYRKCSQKAYAPEKVVEEQIMGVFKFFESITEKEAEQIKSKIRQNHAQEIEYKEKALDGLNNRYKALQKRLDVLYNDRLDERISLNMWEIKNKEIVGEQEEIQNQIKKMKTEEAKYFEIWLNILDLARRAREIYEKRSPEEKRLLLNYIFSNLTLKDKKVIYSLTKPVEVLAKRVQEKLDAEKSFELKKTFVKQRRNKDLVGVSTALLHGQDSNLQPID